MSFTLLGILIFFISMTIIYFLCFYGRNSINIKNNNTESIIDLMDNEFDRLENALISGGMIKRRNESNYKSKEEITMEDFTRNELLKIEQRAVKFSEEVVNPSWQRAYINLADACDRLDAMIARTQDRNGMETINDQEQRKKEDISGIAITGGKELKEFE